MKTHLQHNYTTFFSTLTTRREMAPVSKLLLAALLVLMTGCRQLPQRQGISQDAIPGITMTSVISSQNGLLSDNLSKVPGAICAPGADGKCSADNIWPSQCLKAGSSVDVKPSTNPTPSYHSLITDKYSAAVDAPFISASSNSEELREITAVIAGAAVIKGNDESNGYPGVIGLKSCLLRDVGPGKYPKIYWISSANIIVVTTKEYKKVDSAAGVTHTGFGTKGSTFNEADDNQQTVWIGLRVHEIAVGDVAAPTGVAGSSATRPGVDPEKMPPEVRHQVFDIDKTGVIRKGNRM